METKTLLTMIVTHDADNPDDPALRNVDRQCSALNTIFPILITLNSLPFLWKLVTDNNLDPLDVLAYKKKDGLVMELCK